MLGETELPGREKAIIGVDAAAVLKSLHCTYFHNEESRLADVTDDELKEAVNVAGSTTNFSSLLHGNEVDNNDFVRETDEFVAHIKGQEPAPVADYHSLLSIFEGRITRQSVCLFG